MNWTKAVIAGGVGGLVVSLYQYVMHGMVLAKNYMDHPAFSQTQRNPGWFIFVAVVVGVAGGLLFAKTRSNWQAGMKGGVTFGFYLGLIAMFGQFYWPLVLNQFPYWMAWAWGIVDLVGWMIFGVVAGLIYKPSETSETN